MEKLPRKRRGGGGLETFRRLERNESDPVPGRVKCRSGGSDVWGKAGGGVLTGAVLMFQLERRYIAPQHGNTVRLLPSALLPRLTNEARGANRAAHERWDCEISLSGVLAHTHTHASYTHVLMQKNGGWLRGRWWGWWWGGKEGEPPQPCCLNSLQTAYDSSPSPLHMCHGSSQQVISPTRKQAKAADARDKILQKRV